MSSENFSRRFMGNSFPDSCHVETLCGFLYLKVSLAEYRIIASLFSRLSLMYFSIVSGLKPCGQGPMSDFLSFKNDLVFLPGCPKRFFFPLWALCYQNMYWYCPFWANVPNMLYSLSVGRFQNFSQEGFL